MRLTAEGIMTMIEGGIMMIATGDTLTEEITTTMTEAERITDAETITTATTETSRRLIVEDIKEDVLVHLHLEGMIVVTGRDHHHHLLLLLLLLLILWLMILMVIKLQFTLHAYTTETVDRE
jgi:hypothetical protein